MCDAVGNDPRVEIMVSDNVSTDDTENLVRYYNQFYYNIYYRRNQENIGGDRNILKIYQMARGKYVLALGDDDNFVAEALHRLLDIISKDDSYSIIALRSIGGEYKTFEGNTISEYIKFMSFYTTFISGLVFKKTAFDEINPPDKFVSKNLNQVYLQMSILNNNPKFYILAGNILKSNSGQHLPSGYNFAEVFIKNYLDILIEYSGLSKKDMSEEKFNLFNKMIIPWCRLIKAGKVNLSLDGIDQIFKNYYKNESYYKELLQSLNNIIH